MTSHVRRAVSQDAAAIIAVERACFRDAWSSNGIDTILSDEKSLVFLAEIETKIVGYAAAWVVGDEGEVTRVAVVEAERGRGVGGALLETMQIECARRGAKVLFLEVRDGNLAARTLYHKCHWREVGRRKRYYEDGEDALVMRWDAQATTRF